MQRRKWTYSREARKPRYCEECGKRLKRNEAVLCASCFAELLTRTIEPEESEEQTEETEGEEDEE